MRQFVTTHTVANEVRMMRTQHHGALLIVEGPTDKSAYRNLLDSEACRIVVAQGKGNALGALEILEGDKFDGVLAIVDRDFDSLEGTAPLSENAFVTDLHDLECMMVASPAFAKVLDEYATSSRVVKFEKQAGCDVASALVTNATTLGYLRWVSIRENHRLDFEGITFSKFLERETLQIETKKLITEVKNNSQKHALDDSQIEADMESLCDDNHDPWHVSCGHDLLEILSFGLRRTIASRSGQEVNRTSLQRSLRLAYEAAFFEETALYKAVRYWEAANPAYRLLP